MGEISISSSFLTLIYELRSDFINNGVVDVTGNNTTTEILNEYHYYPFGMNMAYDWTNNVAIDNKYQYNGKEMNDDFGLNLNDYGARWYDAALGRWSSVDPLGEKMRRWTPYNYCFGNPWRFVDPDGMAPDWIVGTDGKKVTYKVNKDGAVEWSKNASQDVQRVGNAMLKTETGKSRLDAMIKSETKIKIEISSETKVKSVKQEDGTFKYIYRNGETIPDAKGVRSTDDHSGKGKKYELLSAKIVIYEGSVKEMINPECNAQVSGLSLDEGIGSVGVHESVHAADKSQINNEYGIKGFDNEKKPNLVQQKYIDELKSK
jgi:RHS repeat-associated protein